MANRRIWCSAVAVLGCVFFVVAIWQTRMQTDRSLLPVPKSNRFDALVPFRRHECIEVVSRPNDNIFVENACCSPSEFPQQVRLVVSNDLNIKAVVLIIGIDGSTSFRSLKNALISSVPKPAKLYFFHENSSSSIQYIEEQQ